MDTYLYFTRLKCYKKNKECLFWSFLFPILLITCFYVCFSNLGVVETIETIPIAFVEKEKEQSQMLLQVLEESEIREGVKLFQVTISSEEEAKDLLHKKKINGYIVSGLEQELYVSDSGMNETIIKTFLDNYLKYTNTYAKLLLHNPNLTIEEFMETTKVSTSYLKDISEDRNLDMWLIWYYAMVAFTCMMGANWGLQEAMDINADQSARAARINVSPLRKMKLYLNNLLAAFTVQGLSLTTLLLYMRYVLNIQFGDKLLFVIVVCVLGSLVGICLGTVIGIYVKASRSVKDAILSAISTGGGFLAGMMMPNVKYWISENVPIIGYINPANLIVDALYSLSYFDDLKRYLLDVTILGVLATLLIVLSILGVRRKTYESI